jgi:hypothetical protein
VGWDEELFAVLDELEQQAEALYDADREAEVADRTRAEYGAVTLASRLMASVESEISLEVTGLGRLAGTLRRVATGWLLLDAVGAEWVVLLDAVAAVGGASPRSVPEVAWSPITRLGVGSALRRLAEAGERCVVHRVDGGRSDGVVRRVGQDFCEVEVAAGRIELVAFSAVAAVQSRP